jgi:hypothetical protein
MDHRRCSAFRKIMLASACSTGKFRAPAPARSHDEGRADTFAGRNDLPP